jgi:Fic family protein
MQGKLISATWIYDPADDYVPAAHRKACRYEAFVPHPIAGWTAQLTGALAGVVADAEHAVASLTAGHDPALNALARLLLRTEAIASSKIERMQVGTRELARAEAKQGLGSTIGVEARAILAGIDAMQYAIDEAAGEPNGLASARMLEIHRVLMKDAAPWTTPGQFRTEQNWIGGNNYNPCGADFVPPPPADVARLLADLTEASADDSLPTIVQCALVHAQFESIHPFNDGNGRVGRALIHVVLRRRGLVTNFVPPVSVVLANRRDEYIDALTAFRAGRPDTWIELFAVSVARSVVIAQRYMDDVRELHATWRTRVEALPSKPRADAAVWQLIDRLPAHPVLTGPAAVTSVGRSKPAVNQAIEQLVEAGVLEPLSAGARNRSWEPVGLLDLIARLERDA